MALFCRRAGIDDSTPHTLGRCRQLFSHRPYPWHSVLVGCLIALGSIPPVHAASIASPQPATGWQDKPVVHAERFMAVTAHPLATRTAEDVLANGGTAVDAAVAVQMVLNLVEPQSSGIGGGAFMLYWDAVARRLYALDGRETAPAAADADYFRDANGATLKWRKAMLGGRAVGIPGTLHLLHTAHDLFGEKSWADLFEPAIALATSGFTVSPRLAQSIAGAADRGLRQFSAARAYFFDANGTPLKVGFTLKNPAFADTLRKIAQEGIAPFYRGAIASRLLKTLENTSELPALMTREDLAQYQTILRPPVCAPYRGYSVCGMGPPSSGALTVGQILGLVERFDLPNMGPNPHSIHLILEASRLAFADRARYMADSDFVPVPVVGLLDSGYLARRSRMIHVESSIGEAPAGTPPGALTANATVYQPESAGTSHLSIIDGLGNIVSMTTTIESGFGSRLMTDGFLLNNELTDFAFVGERDGLEVANRVEGGKRPRSSMAPTIVFNSHGEPVLVTGSPGGSRIICYVAQSLVGVLDWGMSPQQAVSMPHFCNRNGTTDLEPAEATAQLNASLQGLGHKTQVRDLNSGLHLIQVLAGGQLLSGVDPRREGLAAGD